MVYTVQAITTKSTTKATTKSPITYNDPIIKLITIYLTNYKMKALEVGYLDIRYWILDKICFFMGMRLIVVVLELEDIKYMHYNLFCSTR